MSTSIQPPVRVEVLRLPHPLRTDRDAVIWLMPYDKKFMTAMVLPGFADLGVIMGHARTYDVQIFTADQDGAYRCHDFVAACLPNEVDAAHLLCAEVNRLLMRIITDLEALSGLPERMQALLSGSDTVTVGALPPHDRREQSRKLCGNG